MNDTVRISNDYETVIELGKESFNTVDGTDNLHIDFVRKYNLATVSIKSKYYDLNNWISFVEKNGKIFSYPVRPVRVSDTQSFYYSLTKTTHELKSKTIKSNDTIPVAEQFTTYMKLENVKKIFVDDINVTIVEHWDIHMIFIKVTGYFAGISKLEIETKDGGTKIIYLKESPIVSPPYFDLESSDKI